MNSAKFATVFSAILVLTLHHSHASSLPNQQLYIEPVYQVESLVPEVALPTAVVGKSDRSDKLLIIVNLDQFCIKKIQEKGKVPKTKGIRKCITKIKKKCKEKIRAKGKTPNKKSMKKCIRKITRV